MNTFCVITTQPDFLWESWRRFFGQGQTSQMLQILGIQTEVALMLLIGATRFVCALATAFPLYASAGVLGRLPWVSPCTSSPKRSFQGRDFIVQQILVLGYFNFYMILAFSWVLLNLGDGRSFCDQILWKWMSKHTQAASPVCPERGQSHCPCDVVFLSGCPPVRAWMNERMNESKHRSEAGELDE